MSEHASSEPASSDSRPGPLFYPLGIVVWLAVGMSVAFQPRFAGTTTFFVVLGVAWSLALGVAWFRARGELTRLLVPRGGDLTIGALVGLGLLLASWLGRTTFAEMGSERQAWLFLVFLQIGPPDAIQGSILVSALVIGVCAAEELVFRGFVHADFAARFGERRGFVFGTLAYATVLLPTAFTLAVPGLGPNPLLFLAAIGLGLVLGLVRRITGRLTPVIVAHVVFTYFSATQFRLPGL